MSNKRIIARLDIKGPNLVKGIHLEGLRVLGTPEVFAKYYYENGADELMYMDSVASLYDRNSLHNIIEKTAKETFIPLCIGGGIRTLDNIKHILRSGADKVAINTAAIKNPNFIKEAANRFGSSTIVVAIEAIKSENGQYLAYTDNGREPTGLDVLEWVKEVEKLGAGEVILTSIDKEGTKKGFDLRLNQAVADSVSIPIISSGGMGNSGDAIHLLKNSNTDAIAIASVLHYGLENIQDIKRALLDNEIRVRL